MNVKRTLVSFDTMVDLPRNKVGDFQSFIIMLVYARAVGIGAGNTAVCV